jgi:methylmalonyl-CoA mutase
MDPQQRPGSASQSAPAGAARSAQAEVGQERQASGAAPAPGQKPAAGRPKAVFGPEDLPGVLGLPARERRASRAWESLALLGDLWPAGSAGVGFERAEDRRELLRLAELDLAQGADALYLVLVGTGPSNSAGWRLSAGERELLKALWSGTAAAWPLELSAPVGALGELSALGTRRGALALSFEPWRGWLTGSGPSSGDWAALAQRLKAQATAHTTGTGNAARQAPVLLLSSLEAQAGGAGAEQELSALLLMLEASVLALEQAGANREPLPAQIGFELSLSTDVLASLPKLRALRRLVAAWWRLYAPALPQGSAYLRGVASVRELDGRDPWNNLLRATYQAMGGVLGGADALLLPPFDQPLSRRGALGQRLARNLHTLLAEESRLGVVEDPAAGSYALEARTAALCQAAWERYQSLRSATSAQVALVGQGGQPGALKTEIDYQLSQHQRQLASRRRVRVAVNDFVSREATEPPPSLPVAQRPLRDPSQRDGAAFEALAKRAASSGQPPEVFLLNLGRQRDHHPRASFMDGLLAVGGLKAFHGSGAGGRRASEAVDELWGEFEHSGLTHAVVCGQDEETRACVPLLLARKRPGQALFVAGRFEELERWRQSGLDGGFHLGQDAVQFLDQLLTRLGR